ncbi:MAG: hypothetical protein MUC87_18010 [Bacteroidia bacterium]|jgi:hypothetical protein|nr:hypothetical protein [Bacteroidia bacterium]
MRPITALLFTLILAAACHQNSGKPNTDSASTASNPTNEPPNFPALLNTWAEVMNDSDLAVQTSLYADTIKYYGATLPAEKVFALQADYIHTHRGYELSIVEIDKQERRPDGSWYIHFTKQVTSARDTASYPASIVFAWKRNGWKIVEETDDITDLKGAAENYILGYSPALVEIEGTIEENSAWNTANPGSDPKSDGRMVYYVLIPKQPVTTVAGPHNNPPAEMGVKRIQLRSKTIDLKKWLNTPVRVSGRLLRSTGKDVFTSVQMDVEGVR